MKSRFKSSGDHTDDYVFHEGDLTEARDRDEFLNPSTGQLDLQITTVSSTFGRPREAVDSSKFSSQVYKSLKKDDSDRDLLLPFR
ncbi:hypothetical protein AVEN_174747-1 [Araneus ventricosus]|uniref:Uncharacterized protein n=1 Tax=Araneus ventricosus TaxID=182803 RepID=A0A4Y2BKA0_ARAVE|nr:hypothetical protein AVEN_174747-1 [Araneus ventricosus]